MNTLYQEMTGRALAFDESFTAIRMGGKVPAFVFMMADH